MLAVRAWKSSVRRFRVFVLVGGPLLLASSVVRAQSNLPFGLLVSEQARTSFTLVGAGARAAGMGGAFTAVADDASAASFNPAGLAQLLVPEASVVFDHTSLSDDYQGFSSFDQTPTLPLTDSSTRFDRTGFNFASATIPFRLLSRRFAFQLSAQRAVDFTYDGTRHLFETDQSGQKLYELEQTSHQQGAIYTYSASLAVQPTERTLFGVTVNRWDGNWSFSSTNTEQQLTAGSEKEAFTFSQSNQLTGWNYDVGLLLRYPFFNLGLRYRTPFDATYSFQARLDTNIPTPLTPLPPTRTTLHWPGSLNVGLAVKPSDTFLLAADWARTDWSKMIFDAPDGTHVNFFDLAPAGSTLAGRSDDWRIGAEYLLFVGSAVLPVRAGWSREPQPLRDAVTGDRIVREGWSFGLGLKKGWLSVDTAVRYTSSNGQVSRFLEAEELATGALRATSRGTLDRHDWSVFLSVLVQIPSGSPPERILQEIFVGPSKSAP
jgi:long-chain fatty acid transport protein